jgi:sec-independent protein translocase protein TatA
MGDLAKGIKSFKQNIKEDEKPETAAEQKPAGSIAGPEAQASARTGETTSAPRS